MNRTICFYADDFEFKLCSSAPKGSYLAKIFETALRNHNNTVCAARSDLNEMMSQDLDNSIFLSNEVMLVKFLKNHLS